MVFRCKAGAVAAGLVCLAGGAVPDRASAITVELARMTMTGGHMTGQILPNSGGAIYTENENLTLRDCEHWCAELLESGNEIQEIELDNPRGKTGYVILASGGAQRPDIYIKLQLGSGAVIGRSFHYSEKGQRQ